MAMMATLSSGASMPLVGLGTWKSKPGEVAGAIHVAIEAGYRHIDCAAVYGNEKEVGSALAEEMAKGLKREDIFVTSKLWNTKHRAAYVKPALLQTLQDLRLGHLDLYLIHWPIALQAGDVPFPKHPDGTLVYDTVPFQETWAVLEQCVEEGLVRHIGLSNFNSQQVDEVLGFCHIKPAVLQCECHPYLAQKELIGHCKSRGVVFEAYSPLGSPDRPWAKPGEPALLQDPKIEAIAKKYGKTTAQVLIRFQVDRGVVVIPKSVTPERIRANFDVFDFKLTEEDLAVLETFNRNWRACLPKITTASGEEKARDAAHPHYPWNIPY